MKVSQYETSAHNVAKPQKPKLHVRHRLQKPENKGVLYY